MPRLANLPKVQHYKFEIELKTRLSDEDNQSILNHAVYMPLMEEARWNYFSRCGVLDEKLNLPYVQHSSNIRFLTPGKGASVCSVRVKTLHLGKSSFMQKYSIRDTSTGDVWVECVQTLVMWDPATRTKTDVSADFRRKVAAFEGDLDPEAIMARPVALSAITQVKQVTGSFRFNLPLKTRWVDEDKNRVLSGHIYWTLMEEGRLYYFGKKSGLDLMPPSGSFPFVLHSSNMRYFRPGQGGQDCFVDVRTLELGNSSFSQQYRVRDAASGEIWCEATQVFVMWDVEAKRKMKMSHHFKATVAEYEGINLDKPAKPVKVTLQVKDKDVLSVGDKAFLTKTFTARDVERFADVSEDRNPLHLSKEFALTTRFKQPIVHGCLTSSLFSGLLGLHLPGAGTVYLSQQCQFTAPLYLDTPVTATVTVAKIRPDKPIVTLSTVATDNSTGKVVVKGTAVVMVPKGRTRSTKL